MMRADMEEIRTIKIKIEEIKVNILKELLNKKDPQSQIIQLIFTRIRTIIIESVLNQHLMIMIKMNKKNKVDTKPEQ